jgi:hypothetical protein
MGPHRPQRRTALLALLALGTVIVLLLSGPGERPASAGQVLRANSVCEAQELKARKARDPSLEIEIPPQFDVAFPTLDACRSHDLAWDDAAPGPRQPIPFSHRHHADLFEIDCLYCHAGTERSASAGVPSVETCMGCHAHFSAEYDELEGIQILKEHWEERRTIEWQKVHRLPEHVQFQHQAHVRAGVACQTCHGPVEKLDKLYLVPDTQMGPALMPTRKLEMGWCINCHRDQGASQDCYTCHY